MVPDHARRQRQLDATLGDRIGPSVARANVVEALVSLIETFVAQRQDDESFVETYRRVGIEPYKARVYAQKGEKEAKETVAA